MANITLKGTDFTGIESVDLPQTGGGTVSFGAIPTPRTASDVTISGASVTVLAGSYAEDVTKSVASGTAGTPTASKGTVSNHAVTVTPSVTNTTGYIEGGTKTGTGVSVSASELVSGSQNITSNNTYDVTNLASVVVNVSGGGGTTIDTAGSYPVTAGDTFTIGTGLSGTLNVAGSAVLENDWNLKSSLTDSVGGKTITLSNATRDSNGIKIGGANNNAKIPVGLLANKTYEFDIASMSKSFSSGHGRLIMFTTDQGLVWRSNGYWSVYSTGVWGASGGTNNTYFAGKTVKIVTDKYIDTLANGTTTRYIYPRIYVNNTLWYIPSNGMVETAQLYLGSTANAFYNSVFTGIRIYSGVHV